MDRKFLTFGCFIVILLLWNCSNKESSFPDRIKIIHSKVALSHNNLKLDTIFLSYTKNLTDFFMRMHQNQFHVFDKKICKLFTYDINGQFLDEHLGLGKGPGEISGLFDHIYHNGKHEIVGRSRIHVFDSTWQPIESLKFSLPSIHSYDELLNNPDPSYLDIYEPKYYENHFAALDSANIIYNIESTHPKFNAYNTIDYYKNSKIFGVYNAEKQEVISVFGKKTPVFQKYSYIPNHDYHYYDLVNDTIFVNFEPDSLIYVYDKTFSPLYAFGKSGIQMNQAYDQTQDTDLINDGNKFFIDRVTDGYYYHINYFPEQDILFRSYTTGLDKNRIDEVNDIGENPKRMQIYKGTTLIGDVEVPNKFRVIGYVAPYYYADGYDHYLNLGDKEERTGVYRFKL